jgi:hypothetical protein
MLKRFILGANEKLNNTKIDVHYPIFVCVQSLELQGLTIGHINSHNKAILTSINIM